MGILLRPSRGSPSSSRDFPLCKALYMPSKNSLYMSWRHTGPWKLHKVSRSSLRNACKLVDHLRCQDRTSGLCAALSGHSSSLCSPRGGSLSCGGTPRSRLRVVLVPFMRGAEWVLGTQIHLQKCIEPFRCCYSYSYTWKKNMWLIIYLAEMNPTFILHEIPSSWPVGK